MMEISSSMTEECSMIAWLEEFCWELKIFPICLKFVEEVVVQFWLNMHNHFDRVIDGSKFYQPTLTLYGLGITGSEE